jgi:hypothetical protein
MSQAVADQCRGVGTIVLNTTWQLAPWADVLYAADHSWWMKYPEARTFAGLKVTCGGALGKDVLALKDTGRDGFDADPGCVRTGGNGGYQAIQIAVHGGAKRILLCGFDMRHVRGKAHWHGAHPAPLRNAGEAIYKRWLAVFPTLKRPLEDLGVEVINCTPGSDLKVWPFMELERAIESSLDVQGRAPLQAGGFRAWAPTPRVSGGGEHQGSAAG